MKKIISGIVILLSFEVYAGLPDQDPIIFNLRNRFQAASQPNTAYLFENKFLCKGASAVKNNFAKFEQKTILSFKDDYSFITVNWENTFIDKILHTLNGKELIGTNSLYSVNFAFRQEQQEYLLIEVTGKIENTLLPISAAHANVGSYYYCKPE